MLEYGHSHRAEGKGRKCDQCSLYGSRRNRPCVCVCLCVHGRELALPHCKSGNHIDQCLWSRHSRERWPVFFRLLLLLLLMLPMNLNGLPYCRAFTSAWAPVAVSNDQTDDLAPDPVCTSSLSLSLSLSPLFYLYVWLTRRSKLSARHLRDVITIKPLIYDLQIRRRQTTAFDSGRNMRFILDSLMKLTFVYRHSNNDQLSF